MNLPTPRRALITLCAVLGFLATDALSKPPSPDITTVSINSAGTSTGDGVSQAAELSKNGRFVVFESIATNLTGDPDNGLSDVFVRDLKKGITTLISKNAAGSAANGDSGRPSISYNGRFVAFSSRATDLVDGASAGGVDDVYLYDRRKQRMSLVSTNAAGTGGGNASSIRPSVNANGRFVAFESNATDLVSEDQDGAQDVYVRDMKKGVTILVSVTPEGLPVDRRCSFGASINASGRFVAFESDADALHPLDDNGGDCDIFVRDLKKGVTTLVSANATGTNAGNNYSSNPSISASGRFISFVSPASDHIDAADTNGLRDVFLRDVKKGTTQLVSIAAAGATTGNSTSTVQARGSISANGRFVGFFSTATDLTSESTTSANAFYRDTRKGTTFLVSGRDDAPAGFGNVNGPIRISGNGRVVVFMGTNANIAETDTNAKNDVFVRRMR